MPSEALPQRRGEILFIRHLAYEVAYRVARLDLFERARSVKVAEVVEELLRVAGQNARDVPRQGVGPHRVCTVGEQVGAVVGEAVVEARVFRELVRGTRERLEKLDGIRMIHLERVHKKLFTPVHRTPGIEVALRAPKIDELVLAQETRADPEILTVLSAGLHGHHHGFAILEVEHEHGVCDTIPPFERVDHEPYAGDVFGAIAPLLPAFFRGAVGIVPPVAYVRNNGVIVFHANRRNAGGVGRPVAVVRRRLQEQVDAKAKDREGEYAKCKSLHAV